MSADRLGLFVWNELMTTDADKAVAFYTALMNWTHDPQDMGPMGTYHLMTLPGGTHQAGIMQHPQEGPPSFWSSYVNVADVDATLEKVKQLGGNVIAGPMDIPDVGRMALFSDPQGGVISAFKTADPPEDPTDDMPQTGEFCWFMHDSADPKAAADFYGQVFQWEISEEQGPMGPYFRITVNGKPRAGLIGHPPGKSGPATWMSHVVVDDVDATTAKARELGANVFMEPMDLPGIGRVSVVQDPTGGVIAPFKWAGEGA